MAKHRLIAAVALSLALPAVGYAAEVRLDVRDAEGHAAAGVRGTVAPAAGGSAAEVRSDDAGLVQLNLSPGVYEAHWYFGDVSVATSRFRVAPDAINDVRATVPLYRVIYDVQASNGDPMQDARARIAASGRRWNVSLAGGRAQVLVPAGAVSGSVIWKGAVVPLPPLAVPDERQASLEVPMGELEVRMVQAGTGLGFGPVRVAVAAPSEAFDSVPAQWTDYDGRLRLLRPVGAVRVAGEWFGERTQARGETPGTVTLELPLATRSIPLPDDMSSGGLIRLKQPGFEVWVAVPERGAARLPLAPGDYDAVAHDAERRPRATGVLRVEGNATAAKVAWQPLAGDVADSVRERRLIWPKRLGKQPPSAAVGEGAAWRDLPVAADGGLGLLPAGLTLRVPGHALGRTYASDTQRIPVQLGALDVVPPQSGRIKLIDPLRPDASTVHECTPKGCRVLVPPGSYWIWAPGAQLMRDPAVVVDGAATAVELPALEALP